MYKRQAVNPTTGELWCSTNERDGLGNNLVPDYVTHVQEGGFYGWPWFYMGGPSGGKQDPRHPGKHPGLQSKVITPDILAVSYTHLDSCRARAQEEHAPPEPEQKALLAGQHTPQRQEQQKSQREQEHWPRE